MSFVFNEVSDLFGERKYISCDFCGNDNGSYHVIVKSSDYYSENDESCKLFADSIWPGSLIMSEYLCNHPETCDNKTILELGAGTALPSLIASKLCPKLILTTDFPVPRIIDNMRSLKELNRCNNLIVDSYAWGEDVQHLLQYLHETSPDSHDHPRYDLILLSEVLWKDTYPLHEKLLISVVNCLNMKSGKVLLSFGHRPCEGHSPADDLHFLTLAQEKFQLAHKLLDTTQKYQDALDGQPMEVYLYVLYHKSSDSD